MASADEVVRAFAAAGRTLATAESLTGGLLGATITAVPGASAVYRGGFILYATDAKASVGALDPAGLAEHGAVSAWTVEGLAGSAATRFGADVGVALSGVAGPDGQEGWPPGTVWLGWTSAGDRGVVTASARLRLHGGRGAIRATAVDAAVDRLATLLRD